jgi:putative SOS response-associated peptidase YedK
VSFTVITAAANACVAPIHDRMPVIVEPADFAAWLDPAVESPAALERLLVPSPAANLTCVPVGRAVNDPRRDDPSCAQPAGPPLAFDVPDPNGRGT